ncbi:MAG: hypothetical protein PHN18_04605 [Sulfurospirillaceae bacterium]|nr:hypothetical protein [Sulfurospirillaceae bacterium]MDD2825313.1 hypothetical protein [Sulfurospirillaceae bacterium]
MSGYIAYIAGGALATSFAGNRWLRGASWIALGTLVIVLYMEYL